MELAGCRKMVRGGASIYIRSSSGLYGQGPGSEADRRWNPVSPGSTTAIAIANWPRRRFAFSWIFEDEGIENPAKIERRVPNLPLSRDKNKLKALKRSLVLYRMVFGQPRQEDLLDVFDFEEMEQSGDLFRMNLEPPRSARK